jgi:hypothetical protein
MTKLESNENEIVGRWEFDGTTNRADAACRRIEDLATKFLQKLADSRAYGAWETLFRDPNDGRLWERTYPRGELQGGGPPRLAVIGEVEARKKYDF